MPCPGDKAIKPGEPRRAAPESAGDEKGKPSHEAAMRAIAAAPKNRKASDGLSLS